MSHTLYDYLRDTVMYHLNDIKSYKKFDRSFYVRIFVNAIPGRYSHDVSYTL
jgi:hypothetical protein